MRHEGNATMGTGKWSDDDPVNPRDELAALRGEVSELTTTLNSVFALLREVADSQRKLAGQVRQVKVGVDDVLPLVSRHEAEIAGWLADRTAERPDLESELCRRQHDVWQRFDALVSRQLEQVVNDILRRHDDRLNDPIAKAERFGQVIRLLFPIGSDDDPHAVAADELRQIIDRKSLKALHGEASDIRQAAADLGVSVYWGPVEAHPDWFEPWRSSPVVGCALVVVPAWVAGNRRVAPGRVFRTEPPAITSAGGRSGRSGPACGSSRRA